MLKWAFTAPSVGNLSNNEYILEKPIHKNPIFEGAHSRTFTIFSGLVENPLESPQKFLAPSAPPRNTKKRHVFNINVIDFPYYIFLCQTAVDDNIW